MDLLTPDLRLALRANHARADGPGHDPAPLVKLFNPAGPATWLATELAEDGDALFGLADLGFGCPELGWFSLSELARITLPFGLGIERDLSFASRLPLSKWAAAARATGSIPITETILRRIQSARIAPQDSEALPPDR
ncbi:DUF2958 domain-containing protein [Sphingomonas sp. UYEF23]|uniref:DUF2958 domain-containing protein n=1 Tax=Sphingomonas sp. UYEF23 TaxID=1756408 RepID=UPI00339B551F